MSRQRALILGAVCIVLGELAFASMGVCIRGVATTLPNEVIVFFRNLVGLALLTPWLMRQGRRGIATRIPALHLLRALAGLAAMYCFFHAIARIPLAEAMLLKLTAPLFIPLLASLWLREEIGARIRIAIAVGFLGVLIILQPGRAVFAPVALIGVLGGALTALAEVTVRRLSRSEPVLRTVFYFALFATAGSAVPLAWAWRAPAPAELVWLLAVGVFATLGQWALTTGLSFAPAARLGPFNYFAVVFAAAYGWLLWREPLSLSLTLGAVLIGVAGWIVGQAATPRRRPPVRP